jgi:hypothetical protein
VQSIASVGDERNGVTILTSDQHASIEGAEAFYVAFIRPDGPTAELIESGCG